jgi:hypothetical protein
MIRGTQVERNASTSACALAPDGWFVHGQSWPSLQRFGTMNESCGVPLARSVARPVVPAGVPLGSCPVGVPSGTTCAAQYAGSSMIEWK